MLEIVEAFGKVAGRDIPYQVEERRAGDVAVSFADPTLARTELRWTAERSLAQMCEDTWRWQRANPDGYDQG